MLHQTVWGGSPAVLIDRNNKALSCCISVIYFMSHEFMTPASTMTLAVHFFSFNYFYEFAS